MKVTVCQFEPNAESLPATMVALANHVRSNASEFVLLPEMPFFEWLAIEPRADPRRWERAVRAHAERVAALGDLGADAVAGTRPIVNEAGSRRNGAFLWRTATGTPAGVHEKYYLPDEEGYWEQSWYDRGVRSFETARAGDAIVGFQICTELWFLEWSRRYRSSRVDVVCVPRATPRESSDKWLAGGRAAAVCSGAYCLSSNHWNPPGSGPDCGGLGWIIDPEGEVVTTTSEEEPFSTADIDLEFSRRSKSTYPRYVPE